MSIATPQGVTTIRRHPPPKPAAGNPGKPTRRNEEPRDGQPNKQPMTPAQPKPDQRHRSKWHQKLGTLLSSQETDTHHPEPAFRTSPVRGNFSKLPVPARLVNFAFAADLAVPSRVSPPVGTTHRVVPGGGSSRRDRPPGSLALVSVPPLRARGS